jgi:predicted transcriptional regulator
MEEAMGALPLTAPAETLRVNEEKWTKPLMKAGWTAIPSVLLERQQALGLDAVDVNILLHLARHWWFANELPFPGKKSIAECMNMAPRSIQRRIAQLEAAGLIKRVERWHPTYGRQSNYYDFSGLIKELTPYANEVIAARQEVKEDRDKRRTRKRPVMKIASDSE